MNECYDLNRDFPGMTSKRGIISLADKTSGYTTRTYAPGDETSLVSLFNGVYSNLAGFVPRTTEYWLWSCLKRPDVDEKGILILEKGNTIEGYAVVGKSGNVWELCYAKSSDAKTIVSELLAWTVDYARGVGSDSVVLNAFINDPLVCEVCQEMDFAESPSEPVFLSVLDLPQLMYEILQAKNSELGVDGLFWFNLKECPTWCTNSFGVRAEKNRVTLLKEAEFVPKIVVETNMATLVALMFGRENFLRDVLTARVRITPFSKLFQARKLFSLLQNKTGWFTPRADMA